MSNVARTAVLIAVASLGAWAQEKPPAPVDAEGVEFFEKKIRPVLVEKCYSCHSAEAKKLKAGLRLDTKEGTLKGGETGAASVIPGDPDRSLLVKAIRWGKDEDLKMPPKEKLPANVIADFEAWVKRGAPDPRSGGETKGVDLSKARQHWAFQAPKNHPVPAVRQQGWAKTPIDAFILAKLEANNLKPQPAADRRTLIRRATFALHGMPPTIEEIEAFVADGNFEKVVDRLLASPRYGERWGRHWLDVARYSDTKGYVFQEERRYPFSYTYRDWVIRALNDNLPYDQFLIQQIAADRLKLGDDKSPLAAMGFLTLGRRFLNRIPDIIDDRLDVLSRGTMGLTVACARCHDHKFDPIPTKDYYSLYGVFASSIEPKDQPLLATSQKTAENIAFDAEIAKVQAEVTKYREKRHGEILAEVRKAIPVYLTAAVDSKKNDDLRPLMIERWKSFLEKSKDPQIVEFRQKPTREAADKIAPGLVKAEALDVPLADVDKLFKRDDRDKVRQLENKVDAVKATHPGAPQRAMTMQDGPLVEPHVFIRGNPNNAGEKVPRQFLSILSPDQREPFKDGSGRLELARAIASKDNPLTARVMVNRVWAQHFGGGIVRTPSDFGTRSDPPTHPELLDWLALRFVADGWSLKKLHRLILTSAAWQQRSDDVASTKDKDPDNRLVWKFSRQRLDFEAMRDSVLSVSGLLDPAMYGRAVQLSENPTAKQRQQAETIINTAGDPTQETYARRRSVYLFIDRQNLPNTFRNFDFASPDTHSPQRYTTTVPQQALFLMNSPFVTEQVGALVKRLETENLDGRIVKLYSLIYGRVPTADELAIGRKYLSNELRLQDPVAGAPSVWQYGVGSGKGDFRPLPHFTGMAWQGGAKLPDAKLGWVLLTAEGGHPANPQIGAAIRRWTAPSDGAIEITGKLGHRSKDGDGVRARIVSSQAGELASWTAHNTDAETNFSRIEVKKGDTVDFVVDCRETENSDSFVWSPVVRLVEAPGNAAGGTQQWSASAEFRGPDAKPRKMLTPWERYAQVLLLANEFMFVD